MYIAASVIVLFLSEITLIFAQPPGFGAGPPGLLGGRPIGFGEDFRGVRFGREFGGGTFRPGLGLGPTIGGGINVGGTGLGNGFGGDGVRLGTGFGTLGTGFGTDFGPTRADLGNQFGATGTGFGTGIGRFGATGGGMGLDTPDVIRRLRVNNEFGLDGGQGGLQARRINAIRRNRLNFDDTSGLGGGRFGIGRTLGRPVRLGGTVTAGNGLTTFGGGQRTFTARRGLELPRSTILAGLGQDQTDSFLDPVSGRMVRVLTNNDANNVLTRRRTRPTIATSTRRIDTTATRTRLPATLPATIRQRQAVLRRQTPGIVQTGGVRRDTLARTGTLTGTTGTGQLTFLNGVNGGRMPFQRPLIPLDTLDGTPFIPLNALDVGPVNGRLGVIPGAALRAFDNLSPSQRPITRFPAPSMQSIVRPRPRSLRIHQFRNTIREQSQARQVPQQPTISSSTTSRQRVAQIRMRQEKSEASSRAIQRTASLKSNHNEQTWLQMQQYMAQVLQAQLQHQQKLFSEHTKKQISAQQLKDQEIRRLFSQLAATVESLEKQQTMHLEAIQKERNSKRHLTKDNERQQKELQGLVQNLIETLRGQSQSKHNNTPQANVEMLSLEDSNLILHPVNPNFVESNGISSTSSPSNSTLPTDLEYSLQMLLDSVAALQGSPDHAKPSTPSISVDTSVDMLINDIHSLDNNASPDATSLLPSSQSIYQDPSVTSFDMFISSQSAQHRNSSKGDVFSQTRSDRITGQTGSPSANIGGIVSQSQVRPSNIEYVPLIPGSNPLNDIQEGSLVPFLQINQEQRSQLNGTDRDAIIVEGQSFVDWSYFNKVLQEQGILEPNATTSDHPDVVAAQDALQKLISGQGHAAQNGHSNIVKKQIHPGVDANIQNNKLLQSMTRTDGSPTDQSQLQNGPSSARGLNALNNIGTNQLTFDSVDLANFGSVDPSQSAFLQDRTARIAG